MGYLGYLIGRIIGGVFFGLIPGMRAIRKGHKILGIVCIVLCGICGLLQADNLSALVFTILLVVVACSKNQTRTTQDTAQNDYDQNKGM